MCALIFFILFPYFSYSNEIQIGVVNFNYHEYDDTGELLDEEVGTLSSFYFEAINDFKYIDLNLYLETSIGTVDYDGHTQSGRTHTTKTSEKFQDFGLIISNGYSLPHGSIKGRLALGSVSWNRDIQPTRRVLGLDEVYRWHKLSAGLEVSTNFQNGEVRLATEFSNLTNASVTVDLTESSLGEVFVPLPSGTEYKNVVSLVSYNKINNAYLSIGSVSRIFDKSANVTATTPFGIQYSIHEPRSDMHSLFMSIGFEY